MVDWADNVWAVRAHDGRNRSHVPAQPVWAAFGLRVLQFILAFIILVMTAYAANQFGTGHLAGFGLAWVTFILTWGFIIYLAVSLFIAPQIYNYWAQLVLESLCVIFWLCTWAVLASEAAAVDDYFGYYYYYGKSWRAASNCVKASAALGALLWVTFVITLVFFVMALLNHRKTEVGNGALGTEPKSTAADPAPTEMQNPYPQHPQQTYQQPGQEPHPQQYQQPQGYPVEHQQAYPNGEQQPQAYPIDHQQQVYAAPQQQAYAVPAQQHPPHQQV